MPTEQNLRNAERAWLQEPEFDGEPEEELTNEQRYRRLADSYLEDPSGFVNELYGKETEQEIINALQENYDSSDLAHSVMELFNDYVKQADEVRRLKGLIDDYLKESRQVSGEFKEANQMLKNPYTELADHFRPNTKNP